jgi:methyl coenzyme M reductase subunit C
MEHHNSYNKKDKAVLHIRQITVNEILMVDQDLDQVEVPEVVVMEAQVQLEAVVEMELEVALIVD